MTDVACDSFNVLSLCSGYGGLDLAVARAVRDARTVCYVEREAYAAAILAARMEDGGLDRAPVWSDLSAFDGRRWRGVVDLVVAGFPCQDISVAGKGAGIGGERSGLWKHVLRVLDECGAEFAFLENVSALVRRGLDVVLADLAALGFDAEWGCCTAREVGAPHKRERIFILAHAARSRLEGGRQGLLADGDRDVADAEGDRGQQRRAWRHAEGQAVIDLDGCVDGVADASGHAELPRREMGQELPRSPRDRADDEREVVSDTERLELRIEPRRRGGSSRRGAFLASSSSSEGPSPFPPGPDDLDAWRDLLADRPDVEPAIRRDADGLACRVDRLRALGNGVVPQQAERAFRALYGRLMERQ